MFPRFYLSLETGSLENQMQVSVEIAPQGTWTTPSPPPPIQDLLEWIGAKSACLATKLVPTKSKV